MDWDQLPKQGDVTLNVAQFAPTLSVTVAVNSGSKLDTALIQQLVIGVLGRVADVKASPFMVDTVTGVLGHHVASHVEEGFSNALVPAPTLNQ